MTQAYALKAGEGWTYRMGIDFTVKVNEVRAGGSVAMMEYVTRKGEEPEAHTHATEDEIFYVLEGALSFHCGDAAYEVEAGGCVFLPRGIPHGYTIRSDGTVRLLVVTAPVRDEMSGGWGGFSADLETGGELVTPPGDGIDR